MNFKAIFRLSPLRCKGDEATGRWGRHCCSARCRPRSSPGLPQACRKWWEVGAPLLKRADESLDQAVDQARRLLIHMPLVGKASDLVPVAAMREPLVLGTVQLTLEFAYPPAVVCGLNLVETPRIGLVGREQNDLAGLADGNGSGILVRLGAALIGLVASAAADIVC